MIQSLILVTALSLDSFLASVAYGAKQIRIPFQSAVLISSIGVLFLSISLYTATLLQQLIPHWVCAMISFVMFFLIGLSSIFQGTIKKMLQKYKQKQVELHYSGISFVLNIYLDETQADSDHSNDLSLSEAFYLAIALSIDSLVSGFALGISIQNPLPVLVIAFFMGIIVILLGAYLGKGANTKHHGDLSWVSGILFIVLAVSKVF